MYEARVFSLVDYLQNMAISPCFSPKIHLVSEFYECQM